MFEVICLDAGDPLSVIDDFSPGLDKWVENNIAKKVNDAHSSKSIAFLRQDALTVKCQNLSLSGIKLQIQ